MRRPRMDAPVADEPPLSDGLTAYDELHLIHYLRILDSSREDGAWQQAARDILGIDPDREPARAQRAYDTHLARAQWMSKIGYRHLLEAGPYETGA